MKKRGMWLMGILLLAAVLLTVGIRLSLGGKEAKKEVERRSLGERLAEADQWRKQSAEGTETKEPEEGVTVFKWAFTEIGQESVEPYETALNAALEEKGLSWRVSFTGMEGPKTNGMANPLFYKDQVEEGDYDIISCMDTGYVSLYGMLAREGFLEPLDFGTEEGRKLEEAYPECMWESVEVNGSPCGIPSVVKTTNAYLIFREDLAEKYQISMENLTPEGLEAALRKVTEGEWAEGNGAFSGGQFPIWEWGIEQTALPFIRVVFADGKPKLENILWDEEYLREKKRRLDLLSEGYLLRAGTQEENTLKNGDFFMTFSYSYSEEAVLESFREDWKPSAELSLAAVELPEEARICYSSSGKTGILTGGEKKEEAFALLAAVYSDADLSNALSYGSPGIDYQVKDGRAVGEEGRYWRLFYGGNEFLTLPERGDSKDKRERLWEAVRQERAPSLRQYEVDPQELLGPWVALEEIYLEDWEELCQCQANGDERGGGGSARPETCDCNKSWEEKLEKTRQEAEEAGIDRVMEYMAGMIRELP